MTVPRPARLHATPRGVSPTALQALAEAVTSEVRLLEDLVGIMRRQRSAVSSDDLQGIDDSVYATHRVLVTLGEARRRRRSLSQLVSGSDDFPLRQLDELLGETMTDDLRFARDGLHAVALTLSQEVERNRSVLREAMSSGGDYVRALYGGPESLNLYSADPAPAGRDSRGGVLLDRRG